MLNKILLDLDDVLVDCTGALIRRLGDIDGLELAGFDIHLDWPEDAGRDVLTVYQNMTGKYRGLKEWWNNFDRLFWAELQPLPHMYELIEACTELVGNKNVAICTSPTKCGDCHAGKLDWIERFMPTYMSRQYIMTPRKTFCAAEGTLLIDDFDQNIRDFKRAGGMGIEFPRPWNSAHEHTAYPMGYVSSQLHLLNQGPEQC